MAKLSKTEQQVAASNRSKSKSTPKTVGQRLPRPSAVKVSDVLALPLSDGSFAYARVHYDVTLGVLSVNPTLQALKLDEITKRQPKVAFFVEYCLPVDHPEWIYLGKWKFADFEESKSPPVYIQDIINPNVYRILDSGTIRTVTKEEIKGLQKHGPKDPEQIKDMIEEHFRK
jgi:hypothetical protein